MKKEYRIKAANHTDDRYGPCERCGKPAGITYKQQWRKVGAITPGWVDVGFGHVECLRNLSWKDAPVVE